MDLKIEESSIHDVWEFYLDVMKNREARANIWQPQDTKINFYSFEVEECGNSIEKASSFLKEDKKAKTKKIYIQELFLGSIKVNLSYFKSLKSSWGNSDLSEETAVDEPFLQPGQQSGADAYRQWSEDSYHDNDSDERSQYADTISGQLGLFPSISEAPIKFQKRIIAHVYESEGDIWTSLKSFYSTEALDQLYKILGSLG